MAGQHSASIEVQMGSSCAISDLSGLCQFAGRPEDAMRSFAKNHLGYYKSCLLVFHGVVDAPEWAKNHQWCQGCNYIQEFVAYIRQYNLGEVVEGARAENRANHPGHIIQACTWAPNYDAIERHIAGLGPAAKKKEKV